MQSRRAFFSSLHCIALHCTSVPEVLGSKPPLLATVRGNSQTALEAQDDARGKAWLVLRRGVEMSKQVVNLDRTQREKRQQLQVQAGAERGGEAVLRGGGCEYRRGTRADGFMRAAD